MAILDSASNELAQALTGVSGLDFEKLVSNKRSYLTYQNETPVLHRSARIPSPLLRGLPMSRM
jgi:hypothetical protein